MLSSLLPRYRKIKKYWSIWSVLQFPFVILIFQFPANFVLRKSNKKSNKSIGQTFYTEFSFYYVSDRLMTTTNVSVLSQTASDQHSGESFHAATNNWRVDTFKGFIKMTNIVKKLDDTFDITFILTQWKLFWNRLWIILLTVWISPDQRGFDICPPPASPLSHCTASILNNSTFILWRSLPGVEILFIHKAAKIVVYLVSKIAAKIEGIGDRNDEWNKWILI